MDENNYRILELLFFHYHFQLAFIGHRILVVTTINNGFVKISILHLRI